MKIRGKLLLMVIPLMVLSITTTVYLSYLINKTSAKSEELYYDQLYTANSTLINADRDFYQAYAALLQGLSLSSSNKDIYIEDYKENIQQTLERVNQVKETSNKYVDLANFEFNGITIDGEYSKFLQNMEKLSAAYDIDNWQGNLAAFDSYFNDARDNISNMEDLIEEYAEVSETELRAYTSKLILANVILTIVILILAGLFAVYNIYTIRQSVKGLTEEITIMSNKDLTQQIKVLKGKDEISQLSKAAFSLREQILTMMQAFKNSSGLLTTSSSMMADNAQASVNSIQAIDTAAADLARTATQQAEDATSMAMEIQNINEITKDSISNTTSLADACVNISNVTHDGMKIVDELTQITAQSRTAFQSIFDAISGIDEKAHTITAASDMISDIAGQTNLLSLNASIEAARAGEAGHGFAVVADEIRQLAEQSASSVKTINNMIAVLLESSEQAGKQSELVKQYVNKQLNSVDETQKGFEAILDSVKIVNEGVGNLRNINGNLGDKVNQITDLIEAMAAASEENAATSQELSASTTSMTDSIVNLDDAGKSVSKLSEELNSIAADYKI